MANRIGDTYYFTLDEIGRSGGGGGGGSVSWGDIEGTLANQTDLNTALNGKLTMAQLEALAEEWEFTLSDNSTVTKNVVVIPASQGGGE